MSEQQYGECEACRSILRGEPNGKGGWIWLPADMRMIEAQDEKLRRSLAQFKQARDATLGILERRSHRWDNWETVP